MRGRFVKKIERPKGYVNIDEVYESLNGVEKEEDYEKTKQSHFYHPGHLYDHRSGFIAAHVEESARLKP